MARRNRVAHLLVAFVVGVALTALVPAPVMAGFDCGCEGESMTCTIYDDNTKMVTGTIFVPRSSPCV